MQRSTNNTDNLQVGDVCRVLPHMIYADLVDYEPVIVLTLEERYLWAKPIALFHPRYRQYCLYFNAVEKVSLDQ